MERSFLPTARLLTRVAPVVLLTFVLVAAVAGCGGGGGSEQGAGATAGSESFFTGGTPGGKPQRGGTVTVVSSEAPTSLDPMTVTSPGTGRPSTAIFDTLAELAPGSKEPQPALAASWKISDEAQSYVFQVRPGVKFSNGETLSAEDIAFSLERAKESPTSACSSYLAGVKSIAVTGSSAVTVKLAEPGPTLVDTLSYPCFGIVPKAVVEQDGEKKFGEHPVGTGPFMLSSTTPDFSRIALTRNPDFWRKGMPYLDGLVYKQIENDNARLLAVKSGQAQLGIGVPYSQVESVESTSGLRMVIEPIWGAWINPFNNTEGPLADPKVRRALLYATPYEGIVSTVFKGIATQANSIVGKLKYWKNIKPYPYDQAKAEAILKETKFPNGFPLDIQVQGGETNGELLASILQSTWKEIGVDVSIETLSSTSLFANLFAGKFEMQIIPTESAVNEAYNPDGIITGYLDGKIFPNVKPSAALSALLAKANASVDQGERAKLWQQVQTMSYVTEPSWLPVINLSALDVVSESLRNYNVLLNGHSRMEEVWLSE